jgi:LuxR family maltose regulon positive regulatory protein
MTAPNVPSPPSAARLSAPVPRAGSVVRERLLHRLDRTPPGSVISIVGPAGSGKSTVLAQWSERQVRFAYLRLDRSDADAARLIGGIAAAIARVETLPDELIHQLDRPSDSLEAALLPRLVEALWAGSDPLVLALDEAEVLQGSPAVDALTWLVTHLPERVRLAVASRVAPPLLLERLAVAGRLVSIGPAGLALTADEIARLAEMVGRPLSAGHAAVIAQRTGGWAAAVRLALDLEDPTDITGDATAISAYVREQILAPLDVADRDRLRRISVLDPLTGPLCDAVLETAGSLAWLRQLEQTLPLVTQLGPRRTTFRMHPLLRDVLLDDLQAREPATVCSLRRRAAVAADTAGDIDAAADYAIASEDLPTLEAIVLRRAVPLFWHGRLATVARWVVPFDRDGVRDRHAAVTVLAAWFNALDGRPEAADRWLAIATRSTDTRPMPDGTAGKTPWIAALRSLMMPAGLDQARRDAAVAHDGLPADSWFRQHAGLAGALVAVCDGDLEAATHLARSAAGSAEAVSATPGQVALAGDRRGRCHGAGARRGGHRDHRPGSRGDARGRARALLRERPDHGDGRSAPGRGRRPPRRPDAARSLRSSPAIPRGRVPGLHRADPAPGDASSAAG